jgi:hypothetical protein
MAAERKMALIFVVLVLFVVSFLLVHWRRLKNHNRQIWRGVAASLTTTPLRAGVRIDFKMHTAIRQERQQERSALNLSSDDSTRPTTTKCST